MTRKKILMAIGGSSASGVRMIVVRERTTSRKTCTGSDRALLLIGCVTVRVSIFASMD
jgi:hypothetical protein